jgi:hypothetical protein
LLTLRKDHLDRLRQARRCRDGECPAGAAVHLPLIGRRRAPQVLTRAEPGGSSTGREVLIESFRARERVALANLGAAAGGESLCALSRGGISVPAAKYHEGAACALAEARRAVQAADGGPGGTRAARTALLDVLARWRAQSVTTGRTGPGWTSYLTGGLDALEQMVDGDAGPDGPDTRD